MYRQRLHITVRDMDGWNTLLDVVKEMNAVSARLNQPQATAWTLTVGIYNEIIVESDYASLAEYEASQKVMFSDATMVKQVKRVQDVHVEGKGWSELLETADTIG